MKIDRKIEVYFHCSVMFRKLHLSLSMSSLIENYQNHKSQKENTQLFCAAKSSGIFRGIMFIRISNILII